MAEAATLRGAAGAVLLGRAAPAAAFLLAAIFAATGLGKALDLCGFAAVLEAYRIFPTAAALPLAVAVTAAELAVAALLVVPATRRRGALAALLLSLGNAVLLSVTLLRGIDLANCGCFGVFLARPLTPFSPLEDIALAGLALLARRRAAA